MQPYINPNQMFIFVPSPYPITMMITGSPPNPFAHAPLPFTRRWTIPATAAVITILDFRLPRFVDGCL
jgi:hypothetical protein